MVSYLRYQHKGDHYPSYRFLDGEVGSISVADVTPEPGVLLRAKKNSQYTLGRAITPLHVPTKMEWGDPMSTLTDYVTPDGFPCVSKQMKGIIENLDPGRHQFFPLTLFNTQGQIVDDRFLWVVCTSLDSVHRDKTTLVLEFNKWSAEGVSNPQLVFSKGQVASHHFWRDRHLKSGNLLCSDEARVTLEAASITGVLFSQKEVA